VKRWISSRLHRFFQLENGTRDFLAQDSAQRSTYSIHRLPNGISCGLVGVILGRCWSIRDQEDPSRARSQDLSITASHDHAVSLLSPDRMLNRKIYCTMFVTSASDGFSQQTVGPIPPVSKHHASSRFNKSRLKRTTLSRPRSFFLLSSLRNAGTTSESSAPPHLVHTHYSHGRMQPPRQRPTMQDKTNPTPEEHRNHQHTHPSGRRLLPEKILDCELRRSA